MKVDILGDLISLAIKQLSFEIDERKRDDYTVEDVLNYAIIIRKQIDRFGRNGSINKVQNIHTKKIVNLKTQLVKENKEWIKRMKIFQ